MKVNGQILLKEIAVAIKSNVWKKRFIKWRGFLNFFYSVICLRFTRLNKYFIRRKARQLKVDRLHVGCGNIWVKDWLNLTYEKREKYGKLKTIDGVLWLNYNVVKQLPFDSGSIQYLAGSHFIEHLDLNEGIEFFKEAFRVMKKGGMIHMSCPDLGIYVKNYVNRNEAFFEDALIKRACTFKNAKTFGEIFIAKAYDSGGAHRWFYDFDSLCHVLETAGFCEVKKIGRTQGRIPDIEKIELPDREIETLYVEAVKP